VPSLDFYSAFIFRCSKIISHQRKTNKKKIENVRTHFLHKKTSRKIEDRRENNGKYANITKRLPTFDEQFIGV
jgi:hypothetical protein